MEQVGIPFSVVVSEAEEIITQTAPDEVVKELALLKAKEVYKEKSGKVIVIGADTIVSIDGKILGKPADEEEAFSMLKCLQGEKHQVYTGVALIIDEPDAIKQVVFAECTHVEMYCMEDDEIRRYIATGEPMDKAGAYGIQGLAAAYVREIEGDYNNVVGLPVAHVYQIIKKYL